MATKKVIEKKTGEKYASKAMMAKHEKGESKKMRMMEGEIPMKRKGGSVKKYTLGGPKKSIAESLSDKSKTTSVAKMRRGGKMKKYGDGGKRPTAAPVAEPTRPTNEPRFRVKPPTQDSTTYYNEKSKFLRAGIGTNFLDGDFKESRNLIKASAKAKFDEKRQAKKGKPGYDENGYPIKAANYKRKGGKMSCSCNGKGCMKCGGKMHRNGGKAMSKMKKGGKMC
jgi:hypothetical protein